ncbi:hypothetical protein M569_13447 [Genlisea aurea]|uniref:Uncharacterized protein n=1 Tax=Genlisea aurea TaxID=192259 RepID=S8C3I2_9LAMI|nr:hypothetical protein M569_13447 [Genlisea aurea]
MAVLGLVLLSMLAPLVFLLGVHNGYVAEHRNTDHLRVAVQQNVTDSTKRSEMMSLPLHMDNTTERAPPTFLQQRMGNNSAKDTSNVKNGMLPVCSESSGLQAQRVVNQNAALGDEGEMLCEISFGSYCLWRREQREEMGDSVVKKMKDLLFVARAYYPSIAKLPKFDKLSHEMKQNIQEFERILSETSTDKDLPPGSMWT